MNVQLHHNMKVQRTVLKLKWNDKKRENINMFLFLKGVLALSGSNSNLSL